MTFCQAGSGSKLFAKIISMTKFATSGRIVFKVHIDLMDSNFYFAPARIQKSFDEYASAGHLPYQRAHLQVTG